MHPEDLFPCSQETATGRYPQLVPYVPEAHILFL